MLPTATVKESLAKLSKLNSRLQKLLTNCADSGFPAQGRAVAASSTKLPPDVLKRISDSAKDLHDAIHEGYSCKCDNGHAANLSLHSAEDLELDQPFEIVFPVNEDEAKQITQDYPSPSEESCMSEFDTRRYTSINRAF